MNTAGMISHQDYGAIIADVYPFMAPLVVLWCHLSSHGTHLYIPFIGLKSHTITWHVITYPWLKMIIVNSICSIYVVAVQIKFETWISTHECPHKNSQYLKKFSNAYIAGKFPDFLFVPRGSIDNKSVMVQHGAKQATSRCLKQRWPGLRPQRVNQWHLLNKEIVIRSNICKTNKPNFVSSLFFRLLNNLITCVVAFVIQRKWIAFGITVTFHTFPLSSDTYFITYLDNALRTEWPTFCRRIFTFLVFCFKVCF